MLLTTLLLAIPCLLHACSGWDRRAPHFHALFQFQLVGLNGAFLTGDIFNLFVFFEVLLIASYGLMLSGGRGDRMRAGFHYVSVNIAASTLFLMALGLLYGLLGSLNMAEMSTKVAQAPATDLPLIQAAAGLLLPVMFWICRWQGWPFWLCGIVLLPLALPRRANAGSPLAVASSRLARWLPGLIAAAVGVAALTLRSNLSLQYYPVLVSLFFLCLFGVSLTGEQSLVERLARRVEPNLSPRGVRYTRRVTQAWCAFFVLNIALTLWCIGLSEEAWALYSGCVSYLLMGCMFAGEWLIRRKVMKDEPHV
jgi:uncharacterized membrane protein